MSKIGKHIMIGFLLLIVFSSFMSSSGRIGWQENRPLQWTDYEGIPDYEDGFRDAVTASALKFTTRCHKDGSLEVFVSAEFVKDQSWVKEVARSDYHLNHERLHFDITELYARKFRDFLDTKTYTCDDRDLVQSLIYNALKDCMDHQNEYDKHTSYSLNKTQQANWETLIENELKELELFSSK